MKITFWTIFILTFFVNSYGQERHKGFVYIGPVAYQPLKSGRNVSYGGAIGFGAYKGQGSAGIGIEMLMDKKLTTFPVFADVRLHFSKKPSSPFILMQPGYVLGKNTISQTQGMAGTIKTVQEGGIYIAGGVGFISLIKKIGIVVQLKAAMIGSKTTTSGGGAPKSSYNSKPGYVGLSFGVAF